MKIATGIVSLFIAVGCSIHSVLLLFGDIFTGDDTNQVGYICAVMALLFLFGGAFSFKEINIAKILLFTTTAMGFIAVLIISSSVLIWTVAAFVLFFISDHTEPHTIPAAQ